MILLKIISIVSTHPGSGQTTITVNLASGLARNGYHVLIVNPNYNDKLYKWLGIDPEQYSNGILSSRMGIDLLNMNLISSPALKEVDYDYLLFIPASEADYLLLSKMSDYLIACTDLSHNNEVADILSLEKYFHDSPGKANHISLLVLNKINTKEWEHNSQQLFTLADYFGYERIADPIPYCERIHDLPLERRTIWELSQQNLKDAFLRLVEAVENL